MTNQEMVKALKGNVQQKQMLYDYFFAKVSQGEVLEDNEVPMFEAVRKELTRKSEIITMSGSASGTGGAQL
jgi:hypothetical protein